MFASPQEVEGQAEGEPDNPVLIEDDDDLFASDSEECSWWSDDEILNSDYDGQDYIPINIPIAHESQPSLPMTSIPDEQQEGVLAVPYIHAKDTDNEHKQLTVNESEPALKSWLCENCHAINS